MMRLPHCPMEKRVKETVVMARVKKEGKFRYLNVSMPEELLQRLDKYSEKSRIPKTAITEMALEEYLDKVFLSKKTDKK